MLHLISRYCFKDDYNFDGKNDPASSSVIVAMHYFVNKFELYLHFKC